MAARRTFKGIAIIALVSAATGCAFGWISGRASVEPLEVAEAVPVEAMGAPAQPSRARSVEVTTDCIDHARRAAAYPRTFRAAVLESTREPYGPGLWAVRVPFSAENAYGQRVDYVAACREVVGGALAVRIEEAQP